jgi:hypothetical protein
MNIACVRENGTLKLVLKEFLGSINGLFFA